MASGKRTEAVRHVRVPRWFVHGLTDGLCDVSGGRATAEAIPGAELVLIEGMGHNLPPGCDHDGGDHCRVRMDHCRVRMEGGAVVTCESDIVIRIETDESPTISEQYNGCWIGSAGAPG